MFIVKVDTFIDYPIEEVFSFVADNENDPKWCIPVIETDRIVGDAPGAGTHYTFASKMGPMKSQGEFEITVFEKPEKIEFNGQSPATFFRGHYALKAEQGGTRFTEVVEFSPRGFYRLLEPIMPRIWQASYEKQLNNLKQTFETQTR